jgi:hypothetical protein
MKTYKEFISEDKMSYQEALSVFGVQSGYTEEEIKNRYKKLAVTNHPDKGGSDGEMTKINNAYDILKRGKGTVNPNYKDVSVGDVYIPTEKTPHTATVLSVENISDRFGKADRIVQVKIVSLSGNVIDQKKSMWVSQLLKGLK